MSTGLEFSYQIPTKIIFGVGSVQSIADHAKELGLKRPLLVSDRVIGQSDGVKNSLAALSAEGIKAVVWNEIDAEPTDKLIISGLKAYKAESCDGFIAYGGGSSMDTAKCIGVLAQAGDDDPTLYQRGGPKTPKGCPPVIAIPTTSGTGSEVTSVGVFTSSVTGHKLPIRHPSMAPRVAICDPSLTVTMPPTVTMATGIDALSHAAECFTKEREHPFADTLSLQAIKLIAENLKTAIENGRDIEARTRMALAATMAGTAFEAGGLQFHAYAQALGAKYHTPHGVTCGLALRAGLKRILPKATSKLARMAWAFGVDTSGLSESRAAERGVQAAVDFINDVGIRGVTEATPATREDVPWLIKETIETNSLPIPAEEATALWEEIFRG